MTMLELAAAVVVVSIIAIGMTSGAQAVMLHYQSDTVRQDLRQYGNQIMREIARELNLAQKVEIDGQNGFSRIKLYKYFTDISPKLTISCQQRTGIEFNNNVYFRSKSYEIYGEVAEYERVSEVIRILGAPVKFNINREDKTKELIYKFD